MPEIEIHTGHEHNEGNPLILPVSLTISILAVVVAAATLMGHRAHTEELLLQAQASDQWNYYQAKNIRLHEMQVVVDQFAVVTTIDKEKTELLREKYQKEVERYEKDKDAISDKAKELENERDVLRSRADRFDAGEGILEIALVISSITLLTDKKIFWYAGMLIGTVGVVAALAGFLVR
ncbi:MAG TPA: DUF4337 domain-containing protein [Candidatus Acidoferrum sp.]|jgi:hypothetical protein